MRALALTLAAVFALAGCDYNAPVNSASDVAVAVATQGDKVVLTGTKALTVATDAYTAAAQAATTAVQHGHFNNDQLATLDDLNDKALALIKGSDKTLTVAQRAAGLSKIVLQLHSLIGG